MNCCCDLNCFWKKINTKYFIRNYFYFGICSLFIQMCLFLYIIYVYEDAFNLSMTVNQFSASKHFEDLESISKSASICGIPIYIIDESYLLNNSSLLSPVLIASDSRLITNKVNLFLDLLKEEGFTILSILGTHHTKIEPSNRPGLLIGYIMKRSAVFHLVVLHTREDNFWWFGDVNSDPDIAFKLSKLGMNVGNVKSVTQREGALEKFEVVPSSLAGTSVDILIPKYVNGFLSDLRTSCFVECNYTRAQEFHHLFPADMSPEAQRFRHRAWKLLAKAKAVFDSLQIDFWLSSGTCLGFLRECDVIAHSVDVDVGMWAGPQLDSRLITSMEQRGLRLRHWFGQPNDSLELSFVDTAAGLKLDVFFFYWDRDADTVWNGGTQARTGRKFKYVFPRFELCWSLFKGLKVRVPCDTEAYVKANYGPDWFMPVTSWDWKSSPFNVVPNGVWPRQDWPHVIRTFP